MNDLKKKMSRNVAKTKFWIFMGLVLIQLSLVGGTFLAHDRELIPEAQLVTIQSFSDGSGEIKIKSQKFDRTNGIMKLEIQASPEIDFDALETSVFLKNGSGAILQFIPTVDNKASLFIKNISDNFEVASIAFQNNSFASKNVDVNVYEDQKDAEAFEEATSTSSGEEVSNLLYFYVSETSEFLKDAKTPIEIESQEDYAIQAIKSEIKFQKSQIKKMETAISDLKQSQEDERKQIDRLTLKNDYLTGSSLTENENQIMGLENAIANDTQKIEEAKKNIAAIEEKIEKMETQIEDIKSGEFTFPDEVKSKKLK